MVWTKREFEPHKAGMLAGLRVIDMSRLVAGNMTSLQLADQGADVIKVEPLPNGDPLRAWKTENIPTFWKTYARNKRSLGLDFRVDGAIDLIARLIAEADVVIENFRPGTMEKMNLSPEDLLQKHPDLIVLRVSGFGQTGPYGHLPGFGTLVEAMSGFASRNGEKDGGPLLPPLALADMISGLYGAFGVMTALHARYAGKGGRIIDLSLLEPMVSVLGPEAADYRLTQKVKPRVGNGSNTSSPRNVYRTRDAAYIALSGSTQRMAKLILITIGAGAMLDDPRFATNVERVKRRDEVDAVIADWIGARDRDDVMAVFTQAGVTAAPIYDAADLSEDSHFLGRGVFVDMPDKDAGSLPMHATIPRFSEQNGPLRFPAPDIGQHNWEILEEAGYRQDQIDALIGSGLVGEEGK